MGASKVAANRAKDRESQSRLKFNRLHGPRVHAALVAAVFAAALAVRLYAATTVPLMQTEHTWIRIAESLSLEPGSLDLKGPGYNDHPMLQFYLMKISSMLAGDSPLGWRLLNVLIGSLGVLAVYGLGRMLFERGTALAAMVLAALNQFHVAWSRIAMMETVFLTAATVSLMLFWYALQTGRRWAVLANGVVLGLGFLAKESMVLLPPCYFLFLLIAPAYRSWLKRPIVYASLALAMLMVSHEVYWNLTGQSCSLRYVSSQASELKGVSLRPLSFFLGELIEPLVGEDVWTGRSRGDEVWVPGIYEWPMMHWIEGLLLLGCTLSVLRPRPRSPIKLLLVVFLFTVVFTALVHSDMLLNPFYIPALCLVPSLMFAGHRAHQACEHRWGRVAVGLLLVYLAVHLASFVQIDRNIYKPPPLLESFWYRTPKATSQRVMLVGLDGVAPDVLDRMTAQRRMPNLAKLMQSGARARMTVDAASLGAPGIDLPINAPVFWTVVTTGCSPGTSRIDADHHVLSTRRRVPALWNIADYYGLHSVVSEVPGTFPPEPISGRMISWLPDGSMVDPAELQKTPSRYPRNLPRNVPASEGIDWTLDAHVFTLLSSGDDLRQTCIVLDRLLGPLVDRLDDRTWLVLVVASRPDARQAGAAPGEAMMVVAGPGSRRGVTIGDASPLDVTPTLLHVLGLPVFEHLEGRVADDALDETYLRKHPIERAPPCGFDRGWELIDLLDSE